MAKAKVAVSIDARLIKDVDTLVKRRRYASRSAAIESALRSQVKHLQDEDYDAMLAELDADEERAGANEWYKGNVF